MDDNKEAQAEGGRRFQREGPPTEKELELAIEYEVLSYDNYDTLLERKMGPQGRGLATRRHMLRLSK